jgi:DNA-directed RNA polymerase I, II, and III subunit RPABC5
MIIPIRCMNCGKLIADKWRIYQKLVADAQKDENRKTIVSDGTQSLTTPEGSALDRLGLKRSCCRKHFLTHRDLTDKI